MKTTRSDLLHSRRLLITALVAAPLIAAGLSGCSDDSETVIVPDGSSTLEVADFASAETCRECHPDHVDQWEGSMHAYSMSDPVWLAVLQEEWAAGADQFCLQCHSPIGFLTGTTPPFVDFETLPGVVREGITCTTCHAMERRSPAVDDAGAVYHLDPRGPQRGSIPDPQETPAHDSESLPFFSRSSACLPCHDLFIGDNRAEVTYSEWVESGYAPMGFECQDCHMVASEGPAATGGPMRQVHDHRMIGVDIALVDFPDAEANRELVAELLAQSVRTELELPSSVAPGDSLVFEVEVFNTGAGHSIPSGASFLREMWLEVLVHSEAGDTLLASGLRDEIHNVVVDPFLHTFQSTIETSGSSLTTLTSIDNTPLIPALGSRTAGYGVRIPMSTSGQLEIEARVLFRSFAPATLRSVDLDEHIELIAEPFVMDRVAGEVAVAP
jgi:hypothetical protein